ncbi:MAG: DUF2891 domain-containing protein [Gammaproteobacteria bacterium]|jgi:hypothetical protein
MKRPAQIALLGGLLLMKGAYGDDGVPGLDEDTAGRFAALALDCVHREYPNKIAHVLDSDADVAPPRELTPAFYGCFDWHSSVHGHWLLARLSRLQPAADFAAPARAALARSLTSANIGAEVAYLNAPGRASFERPYGLAWLLQLAAELHEWGEPAAALSSSLAPLEAAAAARIAQWLPKLSYPIRIGEHAQTAFAMGLMLDWARTTGDTSMAALLVSRSRDYYLEDRDCPLAYEPSGQDFLSPCLAEADLMRRVLDAQGFADWLAVFMPGIPRDGDGGWIRPERVTDPTDGKLAHLDGLNLSRAWMLQGIAYGLPSGDPRRAAILVSATSHARAGLASVTGEHYEGGHWLGSFATYLVTRRGLDHETATPPPADPSP